MNSHKLCNYFLRILAESGVHVFVSRMAFLLLHFSFVIFTASLFFFHNILVPFWLWKDESNWNIRDISTIVRLYLDFVIFFRIYLVCYFFFKSILLIFNGAWQYFLFPFAIIYTLRGNFRIRSFFGKYRLEKTPYLDIFHSGIRYQSCTLTYKLQDSC